MTTRTNLEQNPSAEVTGWLLGNANLTGTTVARSTVWSQVGTASTLLTKGTGYSYAKPNVLPGITPNGTTRWWGAWVMSPTAGTVRFTRRNSTFSQTPYTLVANTPQWITATWVGDGVTNVYYEIGMEAADASAGRLVYFDAVLTIDQASAPLSSEYFDGSTAATGTETFAWSGTANASTSVATSIAPTANANLSGVGTLSALAVVPGAGALSGVGALSTVRVPKAVTNSGFSGTGSLVGTGVATIPPPAPPTGDGTSRAFDLRLVAYTPLGSRIGPIPDLGITFGSIGGGASTLQAKVATAVYGTLPGPELEVAVEYWRDSTNSWKEGRDSRFAVTLHDYDDRDLNGMVDLTGINLIAFLLSGMALAGATPYTQTNVRSEAAATNGSVSVSGTTFTWPTHVFGTGDLVKVTSKGNATGITTSSVYFVRNPTANTFQISATPSGAIKSCGTASNVGMARVVTRVVFIGGSHSFVKSDAVSLTGGSAIGLNDNTIYYVVNPTAATVQLSDKPGGVPVEMSTANTTFTNIYRNLDGQRVFTNCTPGTVMTAAYLEARDGAGRGVGTGTLHGFTVGADSTGATWTSLTNDPTTPGIGLGFQPGTPGSQMLQALIDNGYAEWYQSGSNGRTFHLVNPLTGNDHTLDARPMRIGTTAPSVKKTIDYSGYRTAVTMRGVGNVIKTVSGATTAWGRLEMYETAAGATTNTMATQLATKEIASHKAEVAYTVTEVAEEAAFLPLENYSRGDWVACQVGGSFAWTKLRCEGWSFSKNGSGTITVTTNLAAVKKTLVAKMAKKTSGMTAGISSGGVGQPLLESDNRKPSAPSGVAATSVPFFNTDDSAEALINVTWAQVLLDIGGTDVQVTDYEVWVRPEGALTGAAIGHVHGLVCDVGPYACGKTFGITVRAKSVTGEWGEFSDEVEVTTTFPATIPAPSTAPTLTSSLGTVRVTWDGNLIDPGSGTAGTPAAGFAYVYAEVSPNGSTGWTGVGVNLGHAGYTVVTGLTKGTTYFFRLTAVNSVGTAGTASANASIAVVGVTGPDMVANTLTANEIAVGAITAEELSLGTVPQTNPADRVPLPLSNLAYWTSVITGTIVYPQGGQSGATATSSGISLSTAGSFCYVVPRTRAPASLKIYVYGVGSGTHAQFQVKTFTSAADVTGTLATAQALTPTPTNSVITLPANTYDYTVKVLLSAGSGTETIASCRVMEVTGTGTANGEAAELSPSGLRLYDDTGHLSVDLTTATQQLLKIYDSTSGVANVVASIDETGSAQFSYAALGGGDVNGDLILDPADNESLGNSQPNNATWPTAPLLDRLARGVIYEVTWNTCNALVISTQYQRIAQDHFVLEDGRQYLIVISDGGLQCANVTGGVNVYVELQFSTTALTSVTSGDRWSRAVLYSASKGYYALPPFVVTARTGATSSAADRILPAGVPIYWQINTNLSSTPSASYQLDEFGETRGLSVIDIGSSQLMRPTGTETLPNATDRTTSGGASGTTTGGTTGTSTTTTFTAAWSRTWNNSGSVIVTGTGQYTNGAAMYQGNGVTPMGAKFGFNALGLVGKTVTAMSVYMYADYFAYSGKSALLGTHGDSAAPATYTGSRANAFSVGWSGGSGKWVSVPSSLWAGFAAGTYRGFTLGVDGSDSNYAYFRGATMANPPKIKITYH